MNEDLILLIEKILGKNDSLKFKDFRFTILFVFIPFVFEIMSVVFIKKQKLETLFMIVFIFAYAIQLLYVIFGLICASKYVYTAQKISESSIYNDFIKYKKTKLDIMELIDKLNTDNPKTLVEFKEYLVYEKSKFANRFSFFYEGIQSVGVLSLIFLFAKNINELSKLETPHSTISIFIFVFPLVASLLLIFEKKRAYKFTEILIYLENCISIENK
ncbi:MAG: hypothetical protein PUE59_10940 [Treponema sp.]|nr:hypothetical protein [Treponema sp.]